MATSHISSLDMVETFGPRPVPEIVAAGSTKEDRSPMTLEVLLATESAGEGLRAAVAGTPWTFAEVTNASDAAESIRGMRAPIVLIDQDLAGSRWLDTLRLLRARRRGVCVIVLASPQGSAAADRRLREEVARRGGFDVLFRPFQRADVLSLLVFAYAQCRISWTRFPRVHCADVCATGS